MSFKSTIWRQRLHQWKLAREKTLYSAGSQKEINDEHEFCTVDEAELQQLQTQGDSASRELLSRITNISPSMIYPYRVTIILRLIILTLFLKYRLSHPFRSAHGLWVASVSCEVWFCITWLLDQILKWQPIKRETYPERLCLRYNQPGKPSGLHSIDVLISIPNSQRGRPLVVSNTILSILSVDYPPEKVSCYVSDDGASLLMLKSLSLTCKFAEKWVPFCKKFNIEPRSPDAYFSKKADSTKSSIYPTFHKERRLMKRQYEDFKTELNILTSEFNIKPSEGWSMKDGTPWPGNDDTNHPGMLQILTGSGEPRSSDFKCFPQLIYVSRERRPGFQHNGIEGALNALVRVSALLTNGAYILNMDCGQYISNSKVFLEAMCFMMDPANEKICYVQFPQRFDGISAHDRYSAHNTIYYDVSLKGLDGIQGPLYTGSCCLFSRKSLYGYDRSLKSEIRSNSRKRSFNDSGRSYTHSLDESSSILYAEKLQNFEREIPPYFQNYEKCYGQSPLLIASIFVKNDTFYASASSDEILREAICVISLDYEDNTDWGREIGWIYGSLAGDILTGLKMHARGWRSIYCMPDIAAFRGSFPCNLSDRLNQVLLWATGSVEILFSRHCPIWYGSRRRLKLLERVAYINATIYPLTSVPLLIYCTLPALCLLTGKFIISPLTYEACIWIIVVILSILANVIFELRWGGVSIHEWWRNQQFWVIAGVSSHFFALFKGMGRVIKRLKNGNRVPTKTLNKSSRIIDLFELKWSSMFVLPLTVLLVNLLAIVTGIFSAVTSGYYASLGVLFAELSFASGVVCHLFPFLKALSVHNKIPTAVILWSLLFAIMLSLIWVQFDPFTTRFHGPDSAECGIEC